MYWPNLTPLNKIIFLSLKKIFLLERSDFVAIYYNSNQDTDNNCQANAD